MKKSSLVRRTSRGCTGRISQLWGALATMLLALTVHAQPAPVVQWQATYGGDGVSSSTVTTAIPTTDGGYLLGGASSASAPGGDRTAANWGETDYWIVKTDADGRKQWDRNYGSYPRNELVLIVPTPDGGYLLGGNSDSLGPNDQSGGPRSAPVRGSWDIWLVKIDGQGNRQWDRSYGGERDDYLGDIARASSGGYFLGGSSRSGANGNKTAPALGEHDYWLVKIDEAGNILWDKAFGGDGSDGLACLQPTADGGLLLGGTSSSGPGPQKSAPLRGPTGGPTGDDGWLVKVDAHGVRQWDQSYGGTARDDIVAITSVGDGGWMLWGRSGSPPSGNKASVNRGDLDYWAVRIDGAGEVLWDESYGGSGQEYLYCVQATEDGGFLLGGYSSSPPSGNKAARAFGVQGYWVMKITSSGQAQWDASFGGSAWDVLRAILPASDGGYVLAGSSSSGIERNKTVANKGLADYWVLKIPASVPPVISEPPHDRLATAGMTVTLRVGAFSFTQPLRYQWRMNGADLAGATNATYAIQSAQPSDAGRYTVVVSNQYGAVESPAAFLTYTDAANLVLSIHPSLLIYGTPGKRYRVERSDEPGGPLTWTLLGEVALTNSPQLFVDEQAAVLPKRLYRVVLAP